MNNTSTISPSSPKTETKNINLQAIVPGRAQTPVATKPAQNRKGGATKATSHSKEVSFKFDASSAKEVLLAGDFTGWEKTPIKLSKGDRGHWNAKVKLAPGQYHYKFVVDGEWKDDPAATTKCPNAFGTCNCVLEIT